MEPIRAALTPDVELRFIVGLPAQAVDLVVLFGTPALVANVPAYRAVRLPTLRNKRSCMTHSDIFFDILGVILTQLPWNQLLQISQPT